MIISVEQVKYEKIIIDKSQFIVVNCINQSCSHICSNTLEILGFNNGALDGKPQIVYQNKDVPSFSDIIIEFDIYYNNSMDYFQLFLNGQDLKQNAQNTNINSSSCGTSPGLKKKYELINLNPYANEINLRFQTQENQNLQFGIDLNSVIISIKPANQTLQCKTQSQPDRCASCSQNSYGRCVCNTKYYWNQQLKDCLPCDRKCLTCIGQNDNCTECVSGVRDLNNKCQCNSYFTEQSPFKDDCECRSTDNRKKDGNQCVCDQTGQVGYYQIRDQQVCEKCIDYCQICEYNSSNCIQCSGNRDHRNSCKCLCGYQEDSSNNCIELPLQSREEKNGKCICKELFYEIQGQVECELCPIRCKTCLNNTSCLTCQPGRDINNDCQCLSGYYQANPNDPSCQKCDSNCQECINSSSNCTKCREDRINPPFCNCPQYQYALSNEEICRNCDISCLQCNGNGIQSCISCENDRNLIDLVFKSSNGIPEGRCACKDGTYQAYQNRTCQKCSTSCAKCNLNKNLCLQCYHLNDILKDGFCYCGEDKIRQPDGSCDNISFLDFEIYSVIDQITYENLIIVEFFDNINILNNKEQIQQFVQFSFNKSNRNLLEYNNYQDINNNINYRLLNNNQQINIIFDELNNNQIIYRVKSKYNFSQLSLKLSLRNTEYVISTEGKILHNKNINKKWNINLANQYNINNHVKETKQQLNVLNNLKNMKFFGIFEYLYIYMVIMPGFQIIAMIQILPIQLPPNLYNVCKMFSSLTFEINQPWGMFNIAKSNTVYNNDISTQNEDDNIPNNFIRLGFTSNFLSNSLEIIVLISVFILITFMIYMIYDKSRNKLSRIILYKHYLKTCFNIFHNLISYYIEATFFIIIISFWLNLIYVQQENVNIVGFIFGFAMLIFLGYFTTYQMCLIELQSDMIANRHMSNFLLICYWYQKFFKIFRYMKKFLILSFLVLLNPYPIVQTSFILAIFTIFLVISIVVRPFMYRIDNIVLILNDVVQVFLASIILAITILYEKEIKNQDIINEDQIEIYLLEGWIAVSIISFFVILNTLYQLYNLKRIFDFVFKEMRKNLALQNDRNYLIEQANQSIYRQNMNQQNNSQNHQMEFNDISDNIVQQGNQDYLENVFQKKIQQKEEAEKINYFKKIILNPNEINDSSQITYMELNPSFKPNNNNNNNNQQQKNLTKNQNINNNNLYQQSQQNIYIQMEDLGQIENQQNIQQINQIQNNNNNKNIDQQQMQGQRNSILLDQDISSSLFKNPYLNQIYHNQMIEQNKIDSEIMNYNFKSFENEQYQNDESFVPNLSETPFSNNQNNKQIEQDNINNNNNIQQLSNQQIYEKYHQIKQQELEKQMRNQYDQKQMQLQQNYFNLQQNKQSSQLNQQHNNLSSQQQINNNNNNSLQDQNSFGDDKINERYNSDDKLYDQNNHNNNNNLEDEINDELSKVQALIGESQQSKLQQQQQLQSNELINPSQILLQNNPSQFNQLEIIPENVYEQDSNYFSPDIFQQRVSQFKQKQS